MEAWWKKMSGKHLNWSVSNSLRGFGIYSILGFLWYFTTLILGNEVGSMTVIWFNISSFICYYSITLVSIIIFFLTFPISLTCFTFGLRSGISFTSTFKWGILFTLNAKIELLRLGLTLDFTIYINRSNSSFFRLK